MNLIFASKSFNLHAKESGINLNEAIPVVKYFKKNCSDWQSRRIYKILG
jgi:hypothetical protein